MSDDEDALEERYRALLQTARTLFSTVNLNDLVRQILQYGCRVMHAEGCSVYLPDRASHELVIHSARGHEDAIHHFRVPWDKGIAGDVFHSQKFERVDDAQNDARLYRSADRKTGFVTRSLLCSPLADRSECFGVLQALNPIGRSRFTVIDEEIFEGLTNIVTGALVRIDREAKIKAEVRQAQELAFAVEIQSSYLPPRSISLAHSEMRVGYRPARTIGGDFYASVPLPGDRLLVAVGDVSGKGIPAALTTAQIMTELQVRSPLAEKGLSHFVAALNTALCQRLAAGRFAAATFLLQDPIAATMQIICAGQFPPWLCQQEAWESVPVPSGLPLGVVAGLNYESVTLPTLPGDKWLLYSDGINEARDLAGEEFGVERLRGNLGFGHLDKVMDGIWHAWEKFVSGAPQHDDACLALLVTKPAAQLNIVSRSCNCKLGRMFIEGWAAMAGFPDLERGRVVLAADEAVTNIIRHTYQSVPDQPIILSAEIAGGELHLRLRDYGPPVDPAKLHGRTLENLRPGGLGLMLLKATFTTVECRRLSDGNEWHLAKPLEAGDLPSSLSLESALAVPTKQKSEQSQANGKEKPESDLVKEERIALEQRAIN